MPATKEFTKAVVASKAELISTTFIALIATKFTNL